MSWMRSYAVAAKNWLSLMKLAAVSINGRHWRECPICGYQGYFKAFSSPIRWDARCPRCSSLERHRLFFLALQSEFLISPTAAILHFSPERALRPILSRMGARYVTANIAGDDVDLHLNIERLDLPDGEFDVIVCNHILEHVDDMAALSEMRRVLKLGGVLYLMCPVIEGWSQTYEDPAIVDGAARAIHFGQWNHVRFYGRDIRDRIERAGFDLREFEADGASTIRFGLQPGERVFVCINAARC